MAFWNNNHADRQYDIRRDQKKQKRTFIIVFALVTLIVLNVVMYLLTNV